MTSIRNSGCAGDDAPTSCWLLTGKRPTLVSAAAGSGVRGSAGTRRHRVHVLDVRSCSAALRLVRQPHGFHGTRRGGEKDAGPLKRTVVREEKPSRRSSTEPEPVGLTRHRTLFSHRGRDDNSPSFPPTWIRSVFCSCLQSNRQETFG